MVNTRTFRGKTYAYYPYCCRSASCGGGGEDCKTCRNGEHLREFKQWVEDHAAIEEDPIWSIGTYTATK